MVIQNFIKTVPHFEKYYGVITVKFYEKLIFTEKERKQNISTDLCSVTFKQDRKIGWNNKPQKTTGLLGLKPGNASLRGFSASHIVSPTLVSDKILIPVVIKPISPAFSSLTSFALGVKTPTFSTIYSWFVDIIFTDICFILHTANFKIDGLS